MPPFLAEAGDAGRAWTEVCRDVVPASVHRPVALATGRANLRGLGVLPVN